MRVNALRKDLDALVDAIAPRRRTRRARFAVEPRPMSRVVELLCELVRFPTHHAATAAAAGDELALCRHLAPLLAAAGADQVDAVACPRASGHPGGYVFAPTVAAACTRSNAPATPTTIPSASARAPTSRRCSPGSTDSPGRSGRDGQW